MNCLWTLQTNMKWIVTLGRCLGLVYRKINRIRRWRRKRNKGWVRYCICKRGRIVHNRWQAEGIGEEETNSETHQETRHCQLKEDMTMMIVVLLCKHWVQIRPRFLHLVSLHTKKGKSLMLKTKAWTRKSLLSQNKTNGPTRVTNYLWVWIETF